MKKKLVSMFILQDCVTLSLTPVAGKTQLIVGPTLGKGRWQTLLLYLVSTIQLETHLVVFYFLFHLSQSMVCLFFCCCFVMFCFFGVFLLIAS